MRLYTCLTSNFFMSFILILNRNIFPRLASDFLDIHCIHLARFLKPDLLNFRRCSIRIKLRLKLRLVCGN